MKKEKKQIEYDLEASVFNWEVAPGKTIKAWGFNNQLPGPVLHSPVKFDERFRNYRRGAFIADLGSSIYQNRCLFRDHSAMSSVRLRPHDTFDGPRLIFQTKDREAVTLLGSAKLEVDDKPGDSGARATFSLT